MESDINDPFVHIDLENLPNYSRQHIIVYRGDSLQAIALITLLTLVGPKIYNNIFSITFVLFISI